MTHLRPMTASVAEFWRWLCEQRRLKVKLHIFYVLSGCPLKKRDLDGLIAACQTRNLKKLVPILRMDTQNFYCRVSKSRLTMQPL
jgi:hypothetical protein